MSGDPYVNMQVLLASMKPEDIAEGLKLVEAEIAKAGTGDARPLFEMLSTLFYIDPLDHPELVPVLDKAIRLTARFGSWVIPILIENLDSGDIKSQLVAAHVLGRLGADAIEPLIKQYTSTTNASLKSFILYALGKVRSPEIVQALPLALDAAQAPNLELRDTAMRTSGKLAEVILPAQLSAGLQEKWIESLYGNLLDENASVRAKAIRSLGKLAKHGHCTEEERARLLKHCRHILGTDEAGDWDRAYVVRKEAAEAQPFFGGAS
jgi:hypothetical protein